MESKDGTAVVAWLSQGPLRWVLAVSLCWGALSCSSDNPQSEEPIATSQSDVDSASQEDSEFASDEGSTKDSSSETLGSLTEEGYTAPNSEDSLEKTLASLSPSDSSPEAPSSSNTDPYPTVDSVDQAPTTTSQKKPENPFKSSVTLGSTPSATYVVAGGDSLTKISKKIFGHTKHWEEIAALNNLNPPYTIYPGQGLLFPLSNGQAKSFAEAYRKNQKSITVQKGDSLSKLAAKVFGNQDSWRRLFNYNKDKILDPNVLPAGITLAYFDGAGEASVESKSAEAPKVELLPPPAPAAPEAAPTPPVAKPTPAPQVKQALKAKVAPSTKAAKKTKQVQTSTKKGSAKAEKPSIKISPSDLLSP